MSGEFSPELQAELLNDFYSEAEEHLNAIRDSLVALEPSVGRAQIDSSVIERLFRSFHSFKGISAIVGLKPAEALAHGGEDYLRDLSRGTTTLSADGVDLLMSLTQRLEQIVRAHREKEPLPEIDSLLQQLTAITPARIVASPAPPSSARETPLSDVASNVEVARARGAVVWHCTFVPNAEMDERLKDPRLHLVRNAVSHGIESTEERLLPDKSDACVAEDR